MKAITLFILMISVVSVHAQSRKEVKEKGIITKTIVDVNYDDGDGIETIKKVYKYNDIGNMVEEIDYDNNKVDVRILYQYNDNNDVIKESHFKVDGSLKKEIEYTFNGKLKIEKVVKDSKGRVLEKRKYVYEYKD